MTGHTEYESRWAIDPAAAEQMGTDELRANFLVETLFVPGRLRLTYTHYDRMIVGGAVPANAPLVLEAIKPTGTENFLDRRELIAVNIGGAGAIEADDLRRGVGPRDMVYVGMGARDVRFSSDDPGLPAKFYLLSAPAHESHPACVVHITDAKRLDLGAPENSNQRSIFQFIHASSPARTCQLVVGLTTFAPGSIWNTMPPHVHDRRMEAYFYFDVPEGQKIFHYMGEGDETRHITMDNYDAVVSPPWSIHAGSGTANYSFIWGMAGENLDYTDMDAIAIKDLK